jgi:hypothetical protein
MKITEEVLAQVEASIWRNQYGEIHHVIQYRIVNCRNGEIVKEDVVSDMRLAMIDIHDILGGKAKYDLPRQDPPGLLVIKEMPKGAHFYDSISHRVRAKQIEQPFVVEDEQGTRKAGEPFGYVIAGRIGRLWVATREWFESLYREARKRK